MFKIEEGFKKIMDEAIWIAKHLFIRNKATGSVANLSFKHNGKVYISGSGTSFGMLQATDFAEVDLEGNFLNSVKPSKELPLHLTVYKEKPEITAVIHTHSTYCVLWSFVENLTKYDCIPDHTPYLKMQLGKVSLVPYEKPGTKALFSEFEKFVNKSDGWLLSHHGPVVPGKSLMSAFNALEEMEESAKIAWNLYSKFK